jgi:hypothetical protein
MTQVSSFWAGYSSSGVIEAVEDFWQYFEPIRRQMPQNCSADVQAVIAHIDTVFTNGSAADQQTIKNTFGLGAVKHLNDASGALRSNLWDWQSLQLSTGNLGVFGQFCDALEVKNGVKAPAAGWGVTNALAAWGKFWTSGYYAQICGKQDAESVLLDICRELALIRHAGRASRRTTRRTRTTPIPPSTRTSAAGSGWSAPRSASSRTARPPGRPRSSAASCRPWTTLYVLPAPPPAG